MKASPWMTMKDVDSWLRYHEGLSVAQICDDLGLPEGRRRQVRGRTLQSTKIEIRKFFAEHGRRPTHRSSASLGRWLSTQGLSIAKVCDDMGLPGGVAPHQNSDDARQEVQQFFDARGRRPTRKDMPLLNGRLRHRGSSLPKLCEQMGLPGGRSPPRTLDGARREVQQFFDTHGCRPTAKDFSALNGWLKYRGSSVPKLCEQMGFPGRLTYNRTIDTARQEVQQFFDTHGRRPTQADLSALNQWLRVRGSSVPLLCRDLGLLSRARSWASARSEAVAFYDARGSRPAPLELRALASWLTHRGSSLSKLCDELGLPTWTEKIFSEGRSWVRSFFDEYGRRPTGRDNCGLEGRLRRKSSSTSKLCDDMGLPPR